MRRVRLRQGVLEIGLAVLVCVLAAGAVVGSGFAQTAVATPNQLTWLRNLRGEVTLVNPETGSAVTRLKVGDPGNPLQVTQGDGVFVVTNLQTGEVTTIDPSMLRIGGIRAGGAGAVQVLLTKGEVYLANQVTGVIVRIDPLSAATVGQPWRSDGPLVAAAADASGSVWALGERGRLTGLRWSGDAGSLVEQQRRDLSGVGAGAVFVPHQQGVTVVGPNGSVSRVGTGNDRTLRATGLTAPLVPAQLSPRELAPVSTPRTSSLHLIRDNGVVTVDTAALDCHQPGQAAVYGGKVYAPCIGDRKVLVLDPDGRRARADLPTAGNAELVPNAGLLIVNVPNEDGLVVMPDGSVRQIHTNDPGVPVVDPSARPTALPTEMRSRPTQPPPDRPTPGTTNRTPPGLPAPGASRTGPSTPGAPKTGLPTPGPGAPTTRAPTTGGPPSGPGTRPAPTTQQAPTTQPAPTQGPRPADFTPTRVTALARPDNSVLVSWTPAPNRPTSYRVLRVDTGEQVATATSAATSAIVTRLPPGLTTSFVVEAVTVAGSFRSQPSNPVSAYGRPGGPNLAVQLAARGPATLTLRITVDVVDNGGNPVTAYDLEVSGGGRTLASARNVPIGQNPYQVDVTCTDPADLCLSGGTVTATGTLINNAGAGPPTTTSAAIDPPPPFNQAENVPVMLVSTGGRCLARDLSLHTCDGSTDQLWTPRDTGVITSAVDGGCLAHNGGSTLTLTSGADSECRNRKDNKRWRHEDQNGTVITTGNPARFRGDGRSVCIAVIGDVGTEGTRVNLLTCNTTAPRQLLWYRYKQTPGVPMAATASARSVSTAAPADRERSPDGAIGGPGTVLLLAPIVVGLVHRRRRRRSRR